MRTRPRPPYLRIPREGRAGVGGGPHLAPASHPQLQADATQLLTQPGCSGFTLGVVGGRPRPPAPWLPREGRAGVGAACVGEAVVVGAACVGEAVVVGKPHHVPTSHPQLHADATQLLTQPGCSGIPLGVVGGHPRPPAP